MSRLWAGTILLIILGVLGGFGLAARPAMAEVNAQDLVNMCEGHTGNPDIGVAMCNMYIAGVTDMHFYTEYQTGQRFFCFKQDTVTGADIRKVFLDWINKNPDKIHQSARYALIEAMIDAYPCRD